MAVGRISGPLLKSNLIRNGIDLAFETDLLYLDVTNNRIGVKNSSPQYDLDITGTMRTTDVQIDNTLDIADINIQGNTISTTQQYLNLGTLDNIVYQNKARIDGIDIQGSVISTNDTNANIEFRPNGTGEVHVHNGMNVAGNIHATGNISADGDIVIGDAGTDSLTINAEIGSDIIPDQTDTFKIGEVGKIWSEVHAQTLFTGEINTQNLFVSGIDLTLRAGNLIYVSENGDDTHSGTHQQDPVATIAQGLSLASAGDTVIVTPGVFTEVFPLTIPVGVTLKGTGIRSVTIQPTAGTNTNDAILLNGETTVEDLTISGFFTGYAFKFANDITVTSRSPYIKNVTVITAGSVTTAEDPRGFNQGDAGKGVLADGSVANAASKEASMLFHSCTFITPGANALSATNGVRIEWLNSFSYFANRGVYAFDGATGLKGDGKTRIRLSGISGTFNAADTVTFTSTDASTVVTVTAESVDNDIIVVDGKNTDLIGFDKTPQTISNGAGATATTIENIDLQDFGAEIRMIGSASVYGCLLYTSDAADE